MTTTKSRTVQTLESKREEEERWQLLTQLVKDYTKGEHSSLPVERVEDLMASMEYTLAQTPPSFGPLAQRFEAGQKIIVVKTAQAKKLLAQVMVTAPDYGTRSYVDTLKVLPLFFKAYKPRFFAHEIPCDIDYQLAVPLDNEALGVDGFMDYLQCLLWENRFLARYDGKRVIKILRAVHPHYHQLLINMALPVMERALSRALLEEPLWALTMNPQLTERLEAFHTHHPRQEVAKAYEIAAVTLAQALDLKDGEPYLKQVAQDFWPRAMVKE